MAIVILWGLLSPTVLGMVVVPAVRSGSRQRRLGQRRAPRPGEPQRTDALLNSLATSAVPSIPSPLIPSPLHVRTPHDEAPSRHDRFRAPPCSRDDHRRRRRCPPRAGRSGPRRQPGDSRCRLEARPRGPNDPRHPGPRAHGDHVDHQRTQTHDPRGQLFDSRGCSMLFRHPVSCHFSQPSCRAS